MRRPEDPLSQTAYVGLCLAPVDRCPVKGNVLRSVRLLVDGHVLGRCRHGVRNATTTGTGAWGVSTRAQDDRDRSSYGRQPRRSGYTSQQGRLGRLGFLTYTRHAEFLPLDAVCDFLPLDTECDAATIGSAKAPTASTSRSTGSGGPRCRQQDQRGTDALQDRPAEDEHGEIRRERRRE